MCAFLLVAVPIGEYSVVIDGRRTRVTRLARGFSVQNLPCPCRREIPGGDASAADAPPEDPKRKSRQWHSRIVKQKTLGGEILVRKWVSDDPPVFLAKGATGAATSGTSPSVRAM